MQGGQDQDLKAASTTKQVQDQSKLLVIVLKERKKGYRSLAKCLPSTHRALGSINTWYHIIEKT